MNSHVDVGRDMFENAGVIADRVLKGHRGERLWDGKPISEPGIYRKIPMEAYHGQLTVAPSISSSGLREIENRSPLHYWATSYLNPDRPEEDSTPTLDFGRAVHTLLLSEDGFRDDYVTRPESYPDDKTGEFKPWSGNSKVCKEWLADRKKEGKTVLLASQVKDIQGMAERLSRDQTAVDLLRGRVERSIIIKDKTGVYVKSRPDSIPADAIIADLKTCADASPSRSSGQSSTTATCSKWPWRLPPWKPSARSRCPSPSCCSSRTAIPMPTTSNRSTTAMSTRRCGRTAGRSTRSPSAFATGTSRPMPTTCSPGRRRSGGQTGTRTTATLPEIKGIAA